MAGPSVTPTSGEWRARRGAALALRAALLVIPFALSFIASTAVTRVIRPHEWTLGNRVASFAVAGIVAVFTSTVSSRWLRRFLPLAWLCELNLAFPTVAPSRIKVALRAGMSHRAEEIRETFIESGLSDDPDLAAHQVLELIASIHRHDRFTRGHCEKTRAVADVIGEQLGLSAADRNRLRWAAMLHDIGKLAVPAEILNSPGKPTPEEWKILQGHPAAGASRIAPLEPWLGEWVRAVDHHHERFDGTGYPYGLAGEDISLSGRIVAVADSYEVMTAVRSYKKAMTAAAARAELTRCAGTHFDPRIVRAFVDVGTRRHPVVGGLLSSWAGRLLLGDGPVAGMFRSVGQTVSAGAVSGAGASFPVVFAVAIPIAAITQAPPPAPVERVAVVATVPFVSWTSLPVVSTSTVRNNALKPPRSTTTSVPSPSSVEPPYPDEGPSALALVLDPVVSVPSSIRIAPTTVAAAVVPTPLLWSSSTAPTTTTVVVTTQPRRLATSTTVGGVGGFSIPTTTTTPPPTAPALATSVPIGGTTVAIIPNGATTLPTIRGVVSTSPVSTSPVTTTGRISATLPGNPTTLGGPITTIDVAGSTKPVETTVGVPTTPVSILPPQVTAAPTTTTILPATPPTTPLPTAPTTPNVATTVLPTTVAQTTTTAAPPASVGPCGQVAAPSVSPAVVTFANDTNHRVLQIMSVDDNCNETLVMAIAPHFSIPITCDTSRQFIVRSVKLPKFDHPRIEVDGFRPGPGPQTVRVS